MSAIFAGLLMFVMLVVCLMLILLVLVQLPKKDAGAGLAFGSGAADALFGAGSGNALTKITKYGTIVFIVLAVFLAWLEDSINNPNRSSSFTKEVQQTQSQGGGLPMQPAPAAKAPAAPATQGTNMLSSMPMMATPSTSAPAPAATGTNSAK